MPVKQRQVNDCIIAAIANTSGVTYKRVKETFGKMPRGGLTNAETEWLLSEFSPFRRRRRSSLPIEVWASRNKGRHIVMLDAQIMFGGAAHAVAVVDGKIHGDYSPDWCIVKILTLEAIHE